MALEASECSNNKYEKPGVKQVNTPKAKKGFQEYRNLTNENNKNCAIDIIENSKSIKLLQKLINYSLTGVDISECDLNEFMEAVLKEQGELIELKGLVDKLSHDDLKKISEKYLGESNYKLLASNYEKNGSLISNIPLLFNRMGNQDKLVFNISLLKDNIPFLYFSFESNESPLKAGLYEL